jgi:Sulfotransferase family
MADAFVHAPTQPRTSILVTGSHRSGTGWVGQVLAASPMPIGYIWEPFSVLHRPGTCAARFAHWFPYVCTENEAEIHGPVAAMLEWRYAARDELGALRRPKDAARMARDAYRYARNRRRGAVPLLKDPIAVFSAEWLHQTFGTTPVLLVRHPAAFAASIKRLHLRHPFGDFLAQPLLMRDRLEPFRAEIERFAAREQDILDQAVLLWNIIHHALADYRARHPAWILVRLEDLSRRPIEEFHTLFDKLKLPRDAGVDALVRATSGSSNPAEASTPDSIRRDSRSHIWNWKRGLSTDEVRRVREGTEAIADGFYGADDW